MAANDTVEQTEELAPFGERVHEAIETLPTEEARDAAESMFKGKVEVKDLTTEKVLENLESAGYTAEKAAQAIAVFALRHSLEMAWWKAGQASGLGSQGKERSGGSGARSRYNAAIGQAGKPGSVATNHAPGVRRGRKAKETEEKSEVTGIIFTHKGGGVYVGPDGEEVKGKKNLPEGAKVA